MKSIDRISNIPKKPHLAILVNCQQHIPGDKRSHEAPGHGYPAETMNYMEYITFDSVADMQEWLNDHADQKDSFLVINCEPKKVSVQINILSFEPTIR